MERIHRLHLALAGNNTSADSPRPILSWLDRNGSETGEIKSNGRRSTAHRKNGRLTSKTSRAPENLLPVAVCGGSVACSPADLHSTNIAWRP